jgi:hypothetical protein
MTEANNQLTDVIASLKSGEDEEYIRKCGERKDQLKCKHAEKEKELKDIIASKRNKREREREIREPCEILTVTLG